MSSRNAFAAGLTILWLAAQACGANGGNGGAAPTGGSTGGVPATGSSGGATSTAPASGGVTSTGGSVDSGGNTSPGNGGATATGGTTGTTRTGGAIGTGGGTPPGSGGSATGGNRATGGATGGNGGLGVGGASATGGRLATGGGPSVGGSPRTGGSPSGLTGTGGTGTGGNSGGAGCSPGVTGTGGSSSFGPLTLYTPAAGDPSPGCLYARALQLRHGGACNGRMYATFERYVPGTPAFPIYESLDRGRTWAKIADVEDKVNGWGNRYQPFLYELPEPIGALPAGTVLLAGNSIPSDLSKTKLDIYKSNDGLRTWTFVSSVASGGRADPSGSYDPVWEPFLLARDGKLICYYSDESDPAHSQKLVHKTSTNGIDWGAVVEDVALTTQSLRPGMATIARMADGKYIMTFEIVGNGNTSYFKISADPESWNPSSQGTSFGSSGSPYVVVMPDGKVVATSYGTGKLYVNTGNGTGSWTQIDAPTGGSYSRGLVVLDQGNLFVIGGGAIGATKNTVTYGALVP